MNPTINHLQNLRLYAMAKALKEQLENTMITTLSFEERLGLLVEKEVTSRENKRLSARLKRAKLQQSACLEDIDYQARRNLDKSFMATLSQCQWVASHHNILIVGPTGTFMKFVNFKFFCSKFIEYWIVVVVSVIKSIRENVIPNSFF
jgi:hypothetical protein